MDKDQIAELFAEAQKGLELPHLDFDENGKAQSPPIDGEIHDRIKSLILQHAPCMLYRYRPLNKYDIDNLTDDSIWLSALNEFNDPFENRVYIDLKAVVDDKIDKDKELSDLTYSGRVIQDSPVYKDFIHNVKSHEKKLVEELSMKRNRIFVACFSETYKSLLMWAHYANSHKGFCIGYEFKDILNEFDISILPIKYSDEFCKIDSSYTLQNYLQVFYQACTTKSKEWSYEKEWRLFGDYRLNEPYRNGMSIKFPKPRCIYLGSNIDDGIKKKLINICKGRNIKAYQMQTSEKGYRLLAYQIS